MAGRNLSFDTYKIKALISASYAKVGKWMQPYIF